MKAKRRTFKYAVRSSATTYYRAFNKKGDVIAIENNLITLMESIKELGEKAVRFERMRVYEASNGWKAMGKPKKDDIQTLEIIASASRPRYSSRYGRTDYTRR